MNVQLRLSPLSSLALAPEVAVQWPLVVVAALPPVAGAQFSALAERPASPTVSGRAETARPRAPDFLPQVSTRDAAWRMLSDPVAPVVPAAHSRSRSGAAPGFPVRPQALCRPL